MDSCFLSAFHQTCCRPMSIQIVWLLLWTSPSKCRDVFLWVNTYPSTILVAEDASAHADSTFSHQNFYMFMGINIYPHCIQILCLWNSRLLWANAHVNYMFVVVGRSQFELHVCCRASVPVFFWASTHPMTISVARVQMYSYGLYLSKYHTCS